MTVQKTRKLILIFIMGFMFLALDIYVYPGIDYPREYKNDRDIIGEYQYYNINSFYGATCTYKTEGFVNVSDNSDTTDIQSVSALEETTGISVPLEDSGAQFIDEVFFKGIRIDVFSDIVGLIFIAIVCIVFAKYKPIFRFAYILSFVTIIVKLTISALPFFINGMTLCNMALALDLSYLVATITTTFFSVRGFIQLAKDLSCSNERAWINTCWFFLMIISLLISLVTWVDLTGLRYFFTVSLVIVILIMGAVFKRIDEVVAGNCIVK